MFVFRTFLFVLILKCLVTSAYSETQLSLDNNNNSSANNTVKLDGPDVVKDVNSTKTSGSSTTTPTIVGEGGEKLPTKAEDVNSTTERSDIDVKSTAPTVTRTYGREGELLEVSKINNTSINVTREANRTVTTSTETSKPVSENPTAEKPVTEKAITTDANTPTSKPRSRIVPKKGVEFDESSTPKPAVAPSTATAITQSTTTTTTTTTTTLAPTTVAKKIPKPTVTTGSEDKKDALVKQKSNNDSTPKVPTIEYYQKTKEDNKRSAFIIPIVAVILSVPIVAIILNVLYKRCKEWWTHRHYSRMDFLIDGMYNN